jgi:hypothetical protein
MRTPFLIVAALLTSSLTAAPARAQSPRATLIEARNLAYDANFRNDQDGLRAAIVAMQALPADGPEGAYTNYYLWWTTWSLVAAQAQANDTAGAIESVNRQLRYARQAAAARPEDPEFQAAFANALIAVAVIDRPQFAAMAKELAGVRQRALELGAKNPRVVMMDAGMIFNNPPERGGSQERGLARWQEALDLFEAESKATAVDPIAPRWGHALARGWMATLFLRMTPPQKEKARQAADAALKMRPDFWWVRDQVLPQLKE